MIEKIIASVVAFFGGFAIVQYLTQRRSLKRLDELKTELIKAEESKIEEAETEREAALEQLREISEHIESADMGELVDLINETFGPKHD